MSENTETKKICVKCGINEGTIGVTNLNQPTRIEGNTTSYEPVDLCIGCFMVMRFGKKC